MPWIRSNVQLRALCALFALALQLTLSFGHVHLDPGFATAQAAALAAAAATDQATPPATPEPRSHPTDFCAICALQLAEAITPVTSATLEAPVVFTSVPFAI